MEIKTAHFVVEYNENEKSCINEVLSLLEDRYFSITKRLGNELEKKTRVKICPDKQELDLALKLDF